MKTIYLASAILLAGVVGSVYHPGETETAKSPSTPVRKKPGARRSPKKDVDEPLADLCSSINAQSGCTVFREYSPLSVAIAFVPDPYETLLRLQFDRTIEAITWAAQDAGFTSFRSQWLPWEVTEPEYARLEDQQHSDEERSTARKQPGLLIFSGQSMALAVFLVGESPTHAFDRDQFANALRLVKSLQAKSKDQAIRIVGPCFSGTLLPLLAALNQEGEQKESVTVNIVSGTVNDTDTEDEFSSQFPSHSNFYFHSFFHGDDLRMNALKNYLKTLYITRQDRSMAVLSEDETVFGVVRNGAPASDQNETDYRFPRGVAYLRNAYQTVPGLFSLPVQEDNTPGSALQLSLKAPEIRHDTVPEFSDQTPVSAEAQLRQITDRLNDDRAQVAVVIASDVLDTLFVAKFLKLAATNTREIFMDSDLLLSRPGDYPSLNGSLEVASYPQMAVRHRWMGDHLMASSSEWEEGLYSAARTTFRNDQDGQAHLENYRLTGRSADVPLWLTVLGSGQEWPVAILNDQDPVPADKYMWHPNPEDPPLSFIPEPASGIWKNLVRLGALLALAYLGAFVYAQRARGKPPRHTRPWTDLWLQPGEPAVFARAFYLLCLTLSIAAAWLAIGGGLLGYVGLGDGFLYWLGFLVIIALELFLIALAVWLTRKTWKGGPAPDRHADARSEWRNNAARHWHYQLLTAVPWIVFLGFIASLCVLLSQGQYFKSYFYSYRSIELGSGVSPALPLLFVFVGFASWSFVHLQRRIFCDERYQLLPGNLSSQQIAAFIPELAQRMEEYVECTFPRPYFGAAVASALLLVSAYWLAFRHFESLEGPVYDAYYSGAVAILAALIFLSTWRFWICWRRLQLFLEQLALHPIHWALRDLPVEYSWSPIWQSSPRKRIYTQLSRAVECLRQQRRLAGRAPTALEDGIEKDATDLLRCVAARQHEGSQLYGSLQKNLQELAEKVAGELNTGEWTEGSSDTLKKAEDDDRQRTLLLPDDRENGRPATLAKEFVALRFVSFIRYAMVHLRNLLTFIMLGFVLLALSLGCYPFSTPNLLAWTLVGCLLATGFPVVVVFVEMSRDATLSWINNSKAGELEKGAFLLRVTSFGILPLLTVLATHFPSIGRYVFSWVQPVVKAIH